MGLLSQFAQYNLQAVGSKSPSMVFSGRGALPIFTASRVELLTAAGFVAQRGNQGLMPGGVKLNHTPPVDRPARAGEAGRCSELVPRHGGRANASTVGPLVRSRLLKSLPDEAAVRQP